MTDTEIAEWYGKTYPAIRCLLLDTDVATFHFIQKSISTFQMSRGAFLCSSGIALQMHISQYATLTGNALMSRRA